MTYHERYINKLKMFCDIEKRDIAVLGCGLGRECEILVHEGANGVVGFDIDERIGQNFEHKSVTYCKRSIQDTGYPDGSFDIVFSAAVFEHVHDVWNALRESVRICRKRGIIMIISSPLWQSPYGNHLLHILEEMPWCHLLFTPKSLFYEIEKKLPELLDKPRGVEEIIEKMFDPTYFNRYPPATYLEAVDKLDAVSVIKNVIWPAQVNEVYKGEYLPRCLEVGFDLSSLLSGAHFFVGRK